MFMHIQSISSYDNNNLGNVAIIDKKNFTAKFTTKLLVKMHINTVLFNI